VFAGGILHSAIQAPKTSFCVGEPLKIANDTKMSNFAYKKFDFPKQMPGDDDFSVLNFKG